MPNQEEPNERLLATHKHLIRLRKEKLEMLRAAEGTEKRLRLSRRVTRIGRRSSEALPQTAKTCCCIGVFLQLK